MANDGPRVVETASFLVPERGAVAPLDGLLAVGQDADAVLVEISQATGHVFPAPTYGWLGDITFVNQAAHAPSLLRPGILPGQEPENWADGGKRHLFLQRRCWRPWARSPLQGRFQSGFSFERDSSGLFTKPQGGRSPSIRACGARAWGAVLVRLFGRGGAVCAGCGGLFRGVSACDKCDWRAGAPYGFSR